MAHLSGIRIGTKARALVAALALGAAALSLTLSPGQADAMRNDNGARCSYEDGSGYINFYMPGDHWASGNVRYVCTSTGNWRQDSGPDFRGGGRGRGR